MSATPILADLPASADAHQRNLRVAPPRLPLVVVVAVAAGLLATACGGSATDGSMSATIDGMSWHTPGQAFIVTGSDGTSRFATSPWEP